MTGTSKLQKFKVGDVVRFKTHGSVDWEVTEARPHELFRGLQRIVMESGMSGRIKFTTNEHLVHREEAIAHG